ncbi:restriction endonuclease subunit S [Lactobacillus agrestimuris]|uniref:restriction endonuclease subunit S n=1 Tax=Lactobacillus agrestimuris TaxID=2941328 RepID=UPI0020431F7D|nr:restriction endonuclease subunit S [Lactobacillus agrestimuris]
MKTNSLDFDAQALREKILDLAMRGKLVEQNPDDEPASVLLEKIKAEKEQLIKEKKIKKSKALPPISDDEKPFDIPDSWEWVRLGEIGDYIQRGRSPRYDKINKIHPIISQKCIQWNSISLKEAKYITQEFYDKLENHRFVKKDDILWNSTGTGTVGRINIIKENFDNIPVDSHVTLIRTNSNIVSNYIYYFLMSPTIQWNLNDYLTGTTKQKELGLNSILKVVIPIPPLEEQSRIAAKIAQLFALLRKVESSIQQYTKLQTLLKSKVLDLAMRGKLVQQDPNDESASVLLEKIKAEKAELVKEKKIKRSKPLPPITDDEKPFDIPDSWEWVRLGEIGIWGAGATPSRRHKEYYENGNIPWLKTGDLNDNIVYDTTEKITKEAVKNSSVKFNKVGNVLIAMYGATIGKLAIVGKKMTTNQACCGCQPFNGIYNWYLFFYLLFSRKELIELGTGGAQPNISKQKIENFYFPVPPLREQKRIIKRIEIIFSMLK